MLSKEPGLLGYYLVHAPDPYHELTIISIFKQDAAAEASIHKTLDWFKQHLIRQVQGSVSFTTGQVLMHKSV
jgi:hypothetical protein